MLSTDTIQVLNTPCVLTTKEKLTCDLATHCFSPSSTPPLSFDFTNVHIVAMRTMDRAFLQETSSVDCFISDSQILSWAMALLGGKNHSRVYGPDFMSYFFEHGNPGLRHFFLGGSQDCLDKLCANLKLKQHGITIAGARNGYFKPSDEATIVEEINASQADMVWVGLGTPKQQSWIHRYKNLLNCKAILAVGFAFDVNAGTKADAPAWLGPIGLTWLYRLLREPQRLWKRYLIYNTVFLYRLARQFITSPDQKISN